MQLPWLPAPPSEHAATAHHERRNNLATGLCTCIVAFLLVSRWWATSRTADAAHRQQCLQALFQTAVVKMQQSDCAEWLEMENYPRRRVVWLGLVLGPGRAPTPLGCRRLSCSAALLSRPLLVLAACSRSRDPCEAEKAMSALTWARTC